MVFSFRRLYTFYSYVSSLLFHTEVTLGLKLQIALQIVVTRSLYHSSK